MTIGLWIVGVLGYLLLAAGLIWVLWRAEKSRPTGYCWLCRTEIREPHIDHFDRVHRREWPVAVEKRTVK